MLEREALFYHHDGELQKLIDMVSVYKFGTVVPRKRRNKSSISFVGVDDYELYCFRLRDVMLEDRLRGYRFSNAYFQGHGLPKNSEIIMGRSLQTINITPSQQLENIHAKVLEIPELMDTYMWWADFAWRENAI